MLARHYAQALLAAISGRTKLQTKKLLKNFIALIDSRGHRGILRGVARELGRLHEREERREVVTISSVKKINRPEQMRLKRKHPELFTKNSRIIPMVDTNLVGGTILKSYDRRLDLSYRRALLELYKRSIQTT